MRLAQLRMVNDYAAERERLVALLRHGTIVVAVGDCLMDDVIAQLVKPVVMGELRRQLWQIDADLAGLGVVVD